MKRQILYMVLGILVVLISTPLAYKLVNIVYYNKNLTDEYVPILNGFIHSLMLIGLLLFVKGLVVYIKNEK